MKPLDHDSFHAMEIDALYEELDAPSSAAIHRHAASCDSCASRFERLRRARQRGLSVLVEAVPEDFESRIMAAVDAALAKRAGGPVLVPRMQSGAPAPPPAAPPPAGPGVTAKVIPFFARPSFAVAATLILVLGAAAILSQMGMAKRASPVATSMDESSPAAVALSAPSPSPVAAEQAAAPAATATAAFGALAATTESEGKDEPHAARAAAKRPAPKPADVAALAAGPAEPPSPAKNARPSGGAATGGMVDPAFAAAKALYDRGRYGEALPRFESLKSAIPEADLYAARSVQRAQNCTAAAPRFDAVAQRHKGTEVGSRATLEAARCYQQIGQAQAARTRYQATKDEGILAAEAANDLDALDRKAAAPPAAAPAATTSPGTPGAGKPASPKQQAPADPLDNTIR